jgi:hypothetical protein
MIVYSPNDPFSFIGFKHFLHFVAHLVVPFSSFSPWFVTLHLWPTFRPYGDPLFLLHPLWKKDGFPWYCGRCFYITNFSSHEIIMIVVQKLFFLGSYGIDTNVIHLFVLFEHRCRAHYLNTNVICLFILFKHKCCMSIHVVYTWKLCTQLLCLNNAQHSCLNNTNL